MYLVKAASEANGEVEQGRIVYFDAGQIEWVQDEFIQYFLDHTDVFTVLVGPLGNLMVSPGSMASAYIDFNATGEAAMSITINGVVYQEADTAVPATGVWTNGASAANSAASLIAAINGDTRATVPFTAVADVSTAGVWLFWDAVGTAGNIAITTDSASACTVDATSIGGAVAESRKVYAVKRTVTTQQLLSGAIEFPLPFAPVVWNVQAFTSAGIPIAFTDTVTVATTPNRIKITTAGATNLANTNVVHLVAYA